MVRSKRILAGQLQVGVVVEALQDSLGADQAATDIKVAERIAKLARRMSLCFPSILEDITGLAHKLLVFK